MPLEDQDRRLAAFELPTNFAGRTVCHELRTDDWTSKELDERDRPTTGCTCVTATPTKYSDRHTAEQCLWGRNRMSGTAVAYSYQCLTSVYLLCQD